MFDEAKNRLLRRKVIERSGDKRFVHHRWFVKYHLEIVERIARELCARYPTADTGLVDALVWLHDYEKIVDFDNQYNMQLEATATLMQRVGYAPHAVQQMCGMINRYNAKADLASSPIEIQIVSSADAASHLVGPFITLYWYENPSKSIEELQAENQRKLAVDWEKKVTLPEVKAAFDARYQNALEIAGIMPVSFLK